MKNQVTSVDGSVSIGNDRISELALDAANEIDELMNGRSFDIAPVQKFAKLITESFPIEINDSSRSFVESGTVALFLHATEDQPKSMAELTQKALELASNLKATDSTNKDGGFLLQVRNFCLSIASAARTFSDVPYDYDPVMFESLA